MNLVSRIKNLWNLSKYEPTGKDIVTLRTAEKPKKKLATILEPTVDHFKA